MPRDLKKVFGNKTKSLQGNSRGQWDVAAIIPHQRKRSRWKTSRDLADVRTWVRRNEVPPRRHCVHLSHGHHSKLAL